MTLILSPTLKHVKISMDIYAHVTKRTREENMEKLVQLIAN